MQDTHLANLYAKRARDLPSTPDEPEVGADVIDFTFGHPDPRHFPTERIRLATTAALTKYTDTALQYSDFRGSELLLNLLSERLSNNFFQRIENRNLIIGSGSMQIIGLMSQIFIDQGDLVLTEAPTYFRAVTIFRNHDAQVEDCEIDESGLRLDLLEEKLVKYVQVGRSPKFLYTIPSFQNPSGTTLLLERRRGLLDLSSRFGFLILEDTAYNDLWYDNTPPPSLFELDAGVGRVVQMGTFSKVIAPGLAIGWAIGPDSIINRLVEFKVNGGTTPLTSHIAAEFLSAQDFDEHLISLRIIYKEKRDAMIEALDKYMKGLATWIKPGGGYFAWLQMHEGKELDHLWENAIREGVIYLPGKYCFAYGDKDNLFVRLSFSKSSPKEISEGVRRLSIAFKRSISNGDINH